MRDENSENKNNSTNSSNNSNSGGTNNTNNIRDMKKAGKKIAKRFFTLTMIAFLALVMLVLVVNSIVITYPNEFNLITQFGGIVRVESNAGPSFKLPFVQDIRSIPKNIRMYNIPVSEVITLDKKSMEVDCIILFNIVDAELFYSKLSGSVEIAEVRIGNVVYNAMKNIISALDQQTIISDRDLLANRVTESVRSVLTTYGVELVGFETKRIDLPTANKEAVYQRMISERNNIATQYEAEGNEEARKIRTDTDTSINISKSSARADAALIIAEGEAEYMQLLSESYNDRQKAEFYSFIRSLEAAKASLTNNGNILILDRESPLVEVFYNEINN